MIYTNTVQYIYGAIFTHKEFQAEIYHALLSINTIQISRIELWNDIS